MHDSIGEHIRIAQHLIREAVQGLDTLQKYNNAGRSYLLESALRQMTDAYQHVFVAKVQHNNELASLSGDNTPADAGKESP